MCTAYSKYADIRFAGPWIKRHVTSKGTNIDLTDIGLYISIPEQPLDEELDLSIRPCLNGPCWTGPFMLPGGYELTSPVYIIESSKKGEIQNPCTLRIYHYANLLTEADCEKMVFLSSPNDAQAPPTYIFKEIQGGKGVFTPSHQFGEISLKHFCCLTTARKGKMKSDVLYTYSYILCVYRRYKRSLLCQVISQPV